MLFRATALVSFLLALPAHISAKITPSDGCSYDKISIEGLEAGGVSKGFSFSGRSVRITLPESYKPWTAAPMILAYHETHASPRLMEEQTGLSDPEINKDSIVVYVAGVDKKWQGQPDGPKDVDDFDFTDKLIDRLSNKLCIDQSRIFAAGHGSGGGFVHLLACNPHLSTRIAAFAAVNGAFYDSIPQSNIWNLTMCQPGRPKIPMFEIHGGSNGVYDYWGDTPAGGTRAPVVKWFVEWAMRNSCGKPVTNPRVEAGEGITVLERGQINEGRLYNGRVVKAVYRCWQGGEKREMEESIEEMYVRFMKERKEKGLPTEDDAVLERMTEVLEGGKLKEEEGKDTEEKDEKVEKSEESGDTEGKKSDDKKEDVKSAEKGDQAVLSDEDTELSEKEKATVEKAREKKIEEIRAKNAHLDGKGDIVAAHYMLQGVGNNWPRVDMKHMAPKGYSNESGADEGDMVFDSTPLVLGWFKLHTLTPQTKEELEDMANDAGRELMMEAGKAAAKKQAEEEGIDIKDTLIGKDLPDGVKALGDDKGTDEALIMEVNEGIKKLAEKMSTETPESASTEEPKTERVRDEL